MIDQVAQLRRRLPRPLRRVIAVGVATYENWRGHRTIRLGAAIAYYGLFSIVPVLTLSLALAGLFFSETDVQEYLAERLTSFLGAREEDANVVGQTFSETLSASGTITGLGLISAASLIFAASLLVIALQDAFNSIWDVPVRAGIRHSLFRRLASFAVVLGAGAAIVVSFALNAVTAFISRLAPDAPVIDSLSELFGCAASWGLGVGVLTLLLRYLPDATVRWRAALVGGAITALLVAVGTVAIGIYLRRYASSSVVGAAGSVFLVLLWMYYLAQIVLVGAELTRVIDEPPTHEEPPDEDVPVGGEQQEDEQLSTPRAD